MASYALTKKCPYETCSYVSTSPNVQANEHNVSSHVSNIHRGTTKVWYGTSQVTVHRDVKTGLLACPCGEFKHKNADRVRTHARNMHKGKGVTSSIARGSSPSPATVPDDRTSDPNDREMEQELSPRSASAAKRNLKLQDSRYRGVDPNRNKMHVGEDLIPGPSKLRRVNDMPSVSSHKPGNASSSKIASISSPAASVASVFRSTSASTKRKADGDLPGPLSSKVQRVSSGRSVSDSKAKLAKSVFSITPIRDSSVRKSEDAKKEPHAAAPITSDPSPASTSRARQAPGVSAGFPPRPRPLVKPANIMAQSDAQKHARPRPVAGVDASSISSGYSTSTRSSSATPAPASHTASGIHPSGARMEPRCSDCGGIIDPYGKNGMCTMCYRESLPAAPAPDPERAPRCVSCGAKMPGKRDQCTMCQLKALSRKIENTQEASRAPKPLPPHPSSVTNPIGKLPAPALDPDIRSTSKQRKKRVSKQMRQRDFERWFAKWKAAHFAGKKDRKVGDDKTDWWRVETTRNQGGVCYSTPDAFFAALQDALVQHKILMAGAGREAAGVLEFYGSYSIVAQPKIAEVARKDKVRQQMEDLGFRLDNALMGHCLFKYKNEHGTMDHVYKYPCTCGGMPPKRADDEVRHAHRMPDERHAGERCGGTIMVIVGEDNALLAYGIRGQRIAVDIVH
ncbi:hypothetical protein BD311DRAFT_704353 [Dichomitus squalens]|uniref:Uncharacterized protein n=1 Tax=Dichomitus squalens TaxID=114155 RepID=A0A4Q9M9S4_9APHY|nr:hypothetical protein BD311DRAFT_704353 [Dichomitus squalens]